VAVEYFSKWVEAKALRDITVGALQKFFWQNIVCHFEVPKEVTVDNGKQFVCATFREFTTQLGTSLCFALVYHPQSNGVVERANGIIFAGIKKNITEPPKGKWADELPRVIWSHNTTESRTTKYTPFKLLYGEEVVTPEEIKLKSPGEQPKGQKISKKTSSPQLTQSKLARYKQQSTWENIKRKHGGGRTRK